MKFLQLLDFFFYLFLEVVACMKYQKPLLFLMEVECSLVIFGENYGRCMINL